MSNDYVDQKFKSASVVVNEIIIFKNNFQNKKPIPNYIKSKFIW